jgi:hypothetical protein
MSLVDTIGGQGAAMGIQFRNTYALECRDAGGNLKWTEEVRNLTTNVGIADVLGQYFKGAAYTAAFYVGLKGAGAAANADTMASHAGWAEIAAYSNATRPALTLGSVTGTTTASVDNSASKAVFNINGTATVDGAFVATNNTVSGATGTLFGAATFAGGSRAVQSGDTLSVTVTLTAVSG